MYLIKTKITIKGFKPITFNGILLEQEKSKLTLEDRKKLVSEKILNRIISDNDGQLTKEQIESASIKILEFQRKRNDFIFSEEQLIQKQD